MRKKTSVAPSAIPVPTIRQKSIEPAYAIEILKSFYHEAKKEFKKLEKLNASFSKEEDIFSITFIADGFDLMLVVKEGGIV